MANYYMLGGDGKEYGPVSTEQLRQWLLEKRANAKTQIRTDKNSPWVALGAVPEFGALADAAGTGAGPVTGSTPGIAPAGAFLTASGDSTAVVKRLSRALAASGQWMRVIAVLVFIMSALFLYETIGIGLIVAWLPIWFGLILNRAASNAKLAASTGSESDLLAVFTQLRAFFKLSGVLMILLLICAVLFAVVVQIVGSQLSGASGGNMDDMLKNLQSQLGK